jgi:hypothetical protein
MKSFNTAGFNKRLSRVEIQQQLALLSNHSKTINAIKIKPMYEPACDQVEESSAIKYKDAQSVKQLNIWPLRSYRNNSITSVKSKTENAHMVLSAREETIADSEQKYKTLQQQLKDAQLKQSSLLAKNNECYSLIQTVSHVNR